MATTPNSKAVQDAGTGLVITSNKISLPATGPGAGVQTLATGDTITLDAQGRITAASPVVRTLTAGAGLSGGGVLSADVTFSMPNAGPGAVTTGGGSKNIKSIQTDAQGRALGITTKGICFSIIDFYTSRGNGWTETAVNATCGIQIMFTAVGDVISGVRFATGSATSRNWRVGLWNQNGTLKASNVTAVAFSGTNTVHTQLFDTPYTVGSSDLYMPWFLGLYDNGGAVYVRIAGSVSTYQGISTPGQTVTAANMGIPICPFPLYDNILLFSFNGTVNGSFSGTSPGNANPNFLEPVLA